MELDLKSLRHGYLKQNYSIQQVITKIKKKISENQSHNSWIYILNDQELKKYILNLEKNSIYDLPLYGVPFAIKDNIDLEGIPTSVGCKKFCYTPKKSAKVISQLINLGAIPIGKTNMDQFATGLVGTRSDYGITTNSYDQKYISGGSSSGSAVAVSLQEVSFSLGTDTAGSGRVPASLNNIYGLKPSIDVINTEGVFPACKSLDCVSIFSSSIQDVKVIFNELIYKEKKEKINSKNFSKKKENQFAIAIPKSIESFGEKETEKMFQSKIETIEKLGHTIHQIDFSSFLEAAKLLYEEAFLSERYSAIKDFFDNDSSAINETVAKIIAKGKNFTAVDFFKANEKLQKLKQKCYQLLQGFDFAITPTIPKPFTIEEIANDPIGNNSKIGYYTNFMNLLDFSAIAVPVDFYSFGIPFGMTIFSHRYFENELIKVAENLFSKNLKKSLFSGEKEISLVVCGAHMEGLPLNHQITEQGGYLACRTKTKKCYRFFAMEFFSPMRPALIKDNEGYEIDVEVWNIPKENFGNFMKQVPHPLAIGDIELKNGCIEKGFLATTINDYQPKEISKFGSWRNYLKNKN